MVIKALLVLLIELMVCYLLGLFINNCVLKRKTNVIDSTLIGFFAYQIMCQVMTLACYFTTGVVHQLSYIWAAIVVGISVLSIIICKKSIKMDIQGVWQTIAQDKATYGVMFLVTVAFCYYVAINGETNADSQYYIALVNTTAATDTLYKFNPYNGFESDAFFLRRALASFEGHSAILCQLSGLHALVITRITRAVQNVILTGGAVYLWGQSLFSKETDNRNKKTCALVGVYLVLQMVFACNYYTNAAFFLQRAYEGKAFAGNVVLLYVLYLSWQFVCTKDKKQLFVLGTVLWGSVALSSSAMFLVPAATAIVIIPGLVLELWENKGRKRCRE